MFEKLKKFLETKKEQHHNKHGYDLTFDNVAIPEVHTHKSRHHKEESDKQETISYDNVAIPEVHIRRKKKS